MRLRKWLFGDRTDLGHVSPWNDVIAERHATNTERMLLGAAGPSTVVGNRRHEAFWAEVDRATRPRVRRFERRG